MSTATEVETQEQFVKRMDIERAELGRSIRDGNYSRAWAIGVYITHEIREREALIKVGPR